MTGTQGYEAIGVSFAAQRTSTGFLDNLLQYSLDSGGSWTDYGGFSPGTTFGLQSFDFGAITGLGDNPAAGFRIRFDGATGSSGNNRIDNLVVSGTRIPPVVSAVPEPSSLAFLGFGMAALALWRRRESKR
ncbi:MAG: PEP-CTERM sorting domain-containing protein [Acidobacteria bacterium]|nr:PEP-CTERM sorting domain-containing protein [Acidobacteriota bacterium]